MDGTDCLKEHGVYLHYAMEDLEYDFREGDRPRHSAPPDLDRELVPGLSVKLL